MTLQIKRWLERQMGVAPVAPGEDTSWTWNWHLGWPDWALVLFSLFAVAFVVGFYLREGSAPRWAKLTLAVFRLGLAALLLMMLGDLEVTIERNGLPYLVVALDDSESMTVRDSTREKAGTQAPLPQRIEQVRDWLSKDDGSALAGLTTKQKLRFYAHSATVRRLGDDVIKPTELPAWLEELKTLKATGRESLLGANVRTILNDLRGTPPSALILPTDGVTTRGESLLQVAQYAARKQIPIFPIGVGDAEMPRDLEIGDLLVDDTVFVGDDVTFEAKVTGRGFAGKDVTVKLSGEGIDGAQTQTVHIDSDNRPARVRIAYRPKKDPPQRTGTFPYKLEIVPEPREIQVENNRLEKNITFVDEKIRVLVVDFGPRYEFRFLKTLFDRQNTIEVKVLLLESDPEYVQQDKSAIAFFPASPEELAKFDVLVIGDVKPSFFTPQQLVNVKEFVKKGGGVVFIAGQQFAPATFKDTPLEDLLPVKLGLTSSSAEATQNRAVGFRPTIGVDGLGSPLLRFVPDDDENNKIWASLAPQFWYAPAEKLKPGAQVLLEHPTDIKDGKPVPLLAGQFFGAGRTLFQAFDGTWRWRLQVEDLYHARYWVQAVRYLSRAKLLGKNRSVDLTVDRSKYRRGDAVQLRAQFLDESKAPRGDETLVATIEKLGDGGGKTKVNLKRSPGRRDMFEGVFSQTEDGRYVARVPNADGSGAGQSATFTVAPPPGELDSVQMNEEELKEVARLTGGKYFPIAEADKLFDSGVLPAGRRVAVNTDPPYPLWRTWPMLALFVGLLLSEWLFRKRWKMV